MTTHHFTNKKHSHAGSAPFSKFVEDLLNTNLGDALENAFIANRAFVNVLESGEAYQLHVAAPGLTKNDFKLEVKEGMLHISVSGDSQAPAEGIEYRSKEFDFSKFHRAFRLDERVDAEKITAVYESGILTVNLPKRQKDSWKKEIHVD